MSEAGRHKLTGVECLRFLCACSVLCWHYQHFSYVGDVPVNFTAAAQPFYAALKPFYAFGALGVEFFWCISGFIFFWKYRESIRSRRVGGWQFFVLRLSRLYPLHFVTLLFVAAMQANYFAIMARFFVYPHNDLRHFVLQLFMASNWGLDEGYSFNGPVWSISLEVLVYFFFYFSSRLLGSSLLLAVLIAALSLLTVVLKHDPTGVCLCASFFYLGGIAAIAFTDLPKYGSLPGFVADGAAAAAIMAVLVAGAFHAGHASPSPLQVVLICAPALVYLVARHARVSGRAADWAQGAGNLTYASYLLHFPVQLSVVAFCARANIRVPYRQPWFFMCFVLCTLLLSFLCFRWFEMPLQEQMRRKMLRPAAVGAGRAAF